MNDLRKLLIDAKRELVEYVGTDKCDHSVGICLCATINVIDRIDAALADQWRRVEDASGLPMIIAGALYDFGGFLTTRDKVMKVGATENASPMVDAIKEFAALRNLSLDDAAVLSWQQTLPALPESDK